MSSANCHGRTICERGDRIIVDCTECGYVHVVPMYNDVFLENYYKNEYPTSTPSNSQYEKFLTVRDYSAGGSILDFGCWDGSQLSYFADAGWDCTGVEVNVSAAEKAKEKGIDVLHQTINQFLASNYGQWDVINVAYILEHIPRPLEFLVGLSYRLRQGGMLVVEVPNEFNPFQTAYLRSHDLEPYWICLPDHLNYFSKNSLVALAEKAGYSVLIGQTSFPMEAFLLMGQNYLGDDKVGKSCFRSVVQMEKQLRDYDATLLPRLYESLYRCGVGRSIILYLEAY